MTYFSTMQTQIPKLFAAWNSAVGLLLLGIALLVPAANALSTQTLPYVAYVIEPETFVRSGPGGRHYPTSALSAGYAVEVFRHDGDNWCAIRPPDGSYSWVEAHKLRIIGDGTAEVLDDQTVARVGSVIAPNRSAVQVLLERGELVELATSIAAKDRRWLAISPPAGEFRWIAADQISRQPPLENTLENSQARNASIPNRLVPSPQAEWQAQHATNVNRPKNIVGGPRQSDGNAASDSYSHLLRSNLPMKSTGKQSTGKRGQAAEDVLSIDVIAGSPAEAELAQYQANNTPTPPLPPVLDGNATNVAAAQLRQAEAPSSSPISQPTTLVQNSVAIVEPAQTVLGNPSYSAGPPRVRFPNLSANRQNQTVRLDELELRLSQTVLNQPQLWQFDSLRREADVLLSQAESSAERTRIRDFQDQITRFDIVRSRRLKSRKASQNSLLTQSSGAAIDSSRIDPFDSELSSDSNLDPRNQSARQRALADLGGNDAAIGSDASSREIALEDAPNEVRYDAVGLLKPVVSRRKKAPQYALVDEQGEVVSFITPTPDVNLQPLVGKRIGIEGTRGFMPEYRRAHVTASRVTPLEDRRLR